MGGDALPLSCVACVGLEGKSQRWGVCVFACFALFLYVRIAVKSLVDRSHCLVRSILDTIKGECANVGLLQK